MGDLKMNRYFKRVFIGAVCVLAAQNSYTQPTVIVVDGEKVEVKEASSLELIKAGFQKAGKDALNVVQAAVAAACLISVGRHYQMTRDSKDGWKALFTHKDSVSMWLWTHCRSLCLAVGAASVSYVGYKLYRYLACKKAQAAQQGMVDTETQTPCMI